MDDLGAYPLFVDVHKSGGPFCDPDFRNPVDACPGLIPYFHYEADASDPLGQLVSIGFSLGELEVRVNVTDAAGDKETAGRIAVAALVRFVLQNAGRLREAI